MRALLGLALVGVLAVPAAARGGTFFRRGDPGPVVSRVDRLMPFGSRTLAFEATGTYVLGGSGWEAFSPVAGDPRQEYLPGSDEVFAARGSLYGLTLSASGGTLLSRLSPSGTWSVIAEVDAPAGRPLESASESRFYARSGGRLISISLVDGTEREEAPLPASGRFLVVSGSAVLVAAGDAPEKDVYRLDGASWSLVTRWRATARHVFSSGNALFSLEAAREARRLTLDGRAHVVSGEFPSPYRGDPGCSACERVSFHELSGETFTLAAGTPNAGVVHRLVGEAFVPLEPPPPYARVERLDVVGDRLYAFALDGSLYAFDGTAWREVPSPGGRAGADRYFQAAGAAPLFAATGGLWRRDEGGWTKLPAPPGLPVGSFGTLHGDAPVAQVILDGERRILAFSTQKGSWEDLDLPRPLATDEPWMAMPAFGTRDALYVVASSGHVSRLRDGGWTTLVPDVPDRFAKIVETSGATYVLGFSRAYRDEGHALVPAFEGLLPGFRVRDVLEAGETTYLAGTLSGTSDLEAARPALLAVSSAGVRSVLDERDGVDPYGPLALVDDTVFVGRSFPGRFLGVGPDGLREARGETRYLDGIDRGGRFAWGRDGGRAMLLVPTARVRKTLPAYVDTVGLGGVRYRSAVLLANLTPGRVTARLEAGGLPERTEPLGPGEERWLEDPFPGFVGPVAVSFEGASRDGDAFALVRVHHESAGGSAGTSLCGVDAGSFTGPGVLLPPAARAGDRMHLALANAGDGPGEPLAVFARPPEAGVPDWWVDGELLPGRLHQQDVLPPATGAIRLEARGVPRADDLVGYVVRNDGLTSDGAVVPFEPPEPLPLRRSRFLPAVVSVDSAFARYRTEISLARRRYLLTDDEARVRLYRVTYRAAATTAVAAFGPAATTFDVGLRLGDVLRVDDAGAWLAANGVSLDAGGVDGTLTFTCEEDVGAADLVVTAVVTGAVAAGSFGVTVPVLDEGRWASNVAVVPGLLETSGLRSNLALANPEPEGGPDVTLRVSVHRGSDGARAGTLPPITLRPGERRQLHRPLATIGFGDGVAYAVVERTGGTGRFVAYGVLNDTATSDGTYLPMCPVALSPEER